MKELLLGCGSRTNKDLFVLDNKFNNVVRLDINPDHKPDVIHDLRVHPLPFPDNEFDEIHMYEVLEHLAYQGDFKFFFAEFSEYWRILKPNGHFLATVPSTKSNWLWGDPSHKRVILPETTVFLSQRKYEQNKKIGSQMSDFRNIYKADFDLVFEEDNGLRFAFVLKALKG